MTSSLGVAYGRITRYLGFVPNNDEYKVMGLDGTDTEILTWLDDHSRHVLKHVRELKRATIGGAS